MSSVKVDLLKPRKAPRQARAARTIATIVEAAAQVLEGRGLEGFNTNAVAERAGVSIGSLYQYFPSKDALTVALLMRESERFYEEASAVVAIPDGRDAMEFLILASVRQQLGRPVLARLLDAEEARPDLRPALATLAGFQRLFVSVLERLTPAPVRPEIAAADLRAMIRGLVDGAGDRGETDIDDLRHRVRAAVFGYLAMLDG